MKIDEQALQRDLAVDMAKMGFAPEEQAGLIAALVEVLMADLPGLRRAVNAAELKDIAAYSHSLKGTFNNFALPAFIRVTELVTEMELQAKQADGADFAPRLMVQIEGELKAWITN